MKLTKCDKGIYLSNLPKTIIGIIWAIAYPIFYIITAYDVFANRKEQWHALMKRAMTTDYSWNTSARKYEELYNKLIG